MDGLRKTASMQCFKRFWREVGGATTCRTWWLCEEAPDSSRRAFVRTGTRPVRFTSYRLRSNVSRGAIVVLQQQHDEWQDSRSRFSQQSMALLDLANKPDSPTCFLLVGLPDAAGPRFHVPLHDTVGLNISTVLGMVCQTDRPLHLDCLAIPVMALDHGRRRAGWLHPELPPARVPLPGNVLAQPCDPNGCLATGAVSLPE